MGIFDTQDNSKIMVAGSTTRGYGGAIFDERSGGIDAARLSYFSSYGNVTDPETSYVGTPRQIAERYIREGRDLTNLQRRFGK